jgi:hypothetical protein
MSGRTKECSEAEEDPKIVGGRLGFEVDINSQQKKGKAIRQASGFTDAQDRQNANHRSRLLITARTGLLLR